VSSSSGGGGGGGGAGEPVEVDEVTETLETEARLPPLATRALVKAVDAICVVRLVRSATEVVALEDVIVNVTEAPRRVVPVMVTSDSTHTVAASDPHTAPALSATTCLNPVWAAASNCDAVNVTEAPRRHYEEGLAGD